MHQWNRQDTLPIALYIWTEAELVRGNTKRKYREYTDGLDVLIQHQVMLSLLYRKLVDKLFSVASCESLHAWLVWLFS